MAEGTVYCRGCGVSMPQEDMFCAACGAPVATHVADAPAGAPAQPAPQVVYVQVPAAAAGSMDARTTRLLGLVGAMLCMLSLALPVSDNALYSGTLLNFAFGRGFGSSTIPLFVGAMMLACAILAVLRGITRAPQAGVTSSSGTNKFLAVFQALAGAAGVAGTLMLLVSLNRGSWGVGMGGWALLVGFVMCLGSGLGTFSKSR